MLRPVDLQCHSDSQADGMESQHLLHYFFAFTPCGGAS